MAATVAAIGLTASPANPYAAPRSVCALVSPATVAKYAPGHAHGKSIGDDCEWLTGKSGGLLIYAATVDSAAQARTGFTDVIQRTRKANTTNKAMVTGTRAVAGIGDQATAMFETSTALADPGKRGSAVFLFVRSRNAVFQVVRTVADPSAVHPSSAALLPGAIAIAREVMAAMPTLGPGSPGVGVHISLDVSHPAGGVILGDPPARRSRGARAGLAGERAPGTGGPGGPGHAQRGPPTG
jgi:hypothetical protein